MFYYNLFNPVKYNILNNMSYPLITIPQIKIFVNNYHLSDKNTI